jgi:TRAP-type C4-dicarboxylate transport system permease small subunit
VPRVGVLDRVRARPLLAVAIAAAALLVVAWLGWAIYVASDKGFTDGLGVLIAWPALVVAAALILLPLVAIYLLIRPRDAGPEQAAGSSEESAAAAEARASEIG